MVWALLSTFIWSLVSIFRKKALCLTELKWLRFMIFWFSGWFLIWLIFLFLWKVDLSVLTNLTFILVFISIVSIDLFWSKIEQWIYKKEKVSVLMPFESLQKIFIVIAWFFLFWNTSVFTLIITLITIIVIIWFNIDYKNFKLPKFLWLVVFINLIWAIVAILENVMLKITNVQTFFALNDLIKVIFVSISIAFLFKNEALQIFKQTRNFYFFRFWAWIFWWINFLITLFLISELWIVTTILLSFLWMVFKLIFSYFLLKEIPWKKDIILAFIVATLIWIWYYFW